MSAVIENIESKSLVTLPLAKIKLDPDQPRKIIDQAKLKTFAADIAERGILQPITVRPVGTASYMVVYGERRFRAAKLAKLKTVDVIVDATERDPLDRFVDQYAENYQRENLSPMELANFYEAIHKQHDVKVKDIPEVLEKHGLQKIERSYVSNMRRLLNLPRWAQDFIDDGTLSAAHGKHILPVMVSDAALADLEAQLRQDIKYGHKITVEGLKGAAERAFDNCHTDIHWSHGRTQILFDVSTCRDCNKKKPIDRGWHKAEYCLDADCMKKKNAAAFEKQEKKRIAAERKKIGKGLGDLVDDEMPAPETMSKGAKALADGRIERTQQLLDAWLRDQVKAHLRDDYQTEFSIIVWLAGGAKGDTGWYYSSRTILTPEVKEDIRKFGPDITLKAKLDQAQYIHDIVNEALDSMTRDSLRCIAKHCDIKLEGSYTIDREYLDIKSKPELIESTPAAVVKIIENWEKLIKGKRADIVDAVLAQAETYGVPRDLVKMYTAKSTRK